MAKVTFKGKFLNGQAFKNPIDMNTGQLIGGYIIHETKRMIARGQSPVRDIGRFVAYKAQQIKKKASKDSKPRGYPYDLMDRYPDKKVRPVNLKLSGDMLNAMEQRFNFSAQEVTVGIFDQKQALKAETHNRGTQEPRVPKRPFLPTDAMIGFAESIQRGIISIVKKRIASIIKATK